MKIAAKEVLLGDIVQDQNGQRYIVRIRSRYGKRFPVFYNERGSDCFEANPEHQFELLARNPYNDEDEPHWPGFCYNKVC